MCELYAAGVQHTLIVCEENHKAPPEQLSRS